MSKIEDVIILEYHAMAQAFLKVVVLPNDEERNLLTRAKIDKIAQDAESDLSRYLSDQDDPDYAENKELITTAVKSTFMVFAAAAKTFESNDVDLHNYIEQKRKECRVLNM